MFDLCYHQEEENDQKLDDEGRRALLAEARDLTAELARWKVRKNDVGAPIRKRGVNGVSLP